MVATNASADMERSPSWDEDACFLAVPCLFTRGVGHIKNYERGFVAIGAWLVGRTPPPLSLRSSAANPSFHHY